MALPSFVKPEIRVANYLPRLRRLQLLYLHFVIVVFVGDSPNDAPMFAYFPNAVGVANIREFTGRLEAEPAYVAQTRCGEGFVEVVDALLNVR